MTEEPKPQPLSEAELVAVEGLAKVHNEYVYEEIARDYTLRLIATIRELQGGGSGVEANQAIGA